MISLSIYLVYFKDIYSLVYKGYYSIYLGIDLISYPLLLVKLGLDLIYILVYYVKVIGISP